MRFQLSDSNIYPLPGNSHMLHLGTIKSGLREYLVMACIKGAKRGNVYIEEVVLTSVDWSKDIFANCKFIDDDHLVEDLARFAEEKGITNMPKVLERIQAMGKTDWLIG